jgi:hypothetical protein
MSMLILVFGTQSLRFMVECKVGGDWGSAHVRARHLAHVLSTISHGSAVMGKVNFLFFIDMETEAKKRNISQGPTLLPVI